MSKGLGINYLTPEMIQYFKDDVSRGVTYLGGKKLPLPRYYRDRIFTDSEKIRRNKLILSNNFLDKRYEQISSPLFPQRVKKMYELNEKKLQKTD